MLVHDPLQRLVLPFLGLLILGPSCRVEAQPAAAPQPPSTPHATHSEEADSTSQATVSGPVEELFKQRQYEAAVRKGDELRGQKQVTAPNEYWAARALRAMKRYQESATRFRELSKTFPGTDEAASADVDALVAVLGEMPEGHHDAKALKLANDAGTELLGVAKKHADSNPKAQSRALYIAGNAFRMAKADEQAHSAYDACRGLTTAGSSDYSDKCSLGLASIKARTWHEAEALSLYRECALQDRDADTAGRCAKSLARMELVGLPAPEMKMETWLNGQEQSLEKLRGKVVLLFFFATWCPHCKETLPTLPRYLELFGKEPFQLLGVTNNARGQTTESASLFVKDQQWKISYPVGVDANGATSNAMEATGIPQIILIDKRGVIRWSDHPAYLKEEMIAKLLAEPDGV